jgi:hypothetical protein
MKTPALDAEVPRGQPRDLGHDQSLCTYSSVSYLALCVVPCAQHRAIHGLDQTGVRTSRPHVGYPGRLVARDIHWEGVGISRSSVGKLAFETVAKTLHGSRRKQGAGMEIATAHTRHRGPTSWDHLDGLFVDVSL